MAQLIREVMSEDPVRLPAETSVQEAARAMRENDIGGIIVEKDGQLYGIVTDRDIVVRVIADGKDVASTNLESICSKDLITADEKVSDATQLMKDNALRRILLSMTRTAGRSSVSFPSVTSLSKNIPSLRSEKSVMPQRIPNHR